MNEWTNERINEWLDGWMNEWMYEWMNEWIDEWINGWMDGWMNGWINEEWMNGWMDEWVKEMNNEWKTHTCLFKNKHIRLLVKCMLKLEHVSIVYTNTSSSINVSQRIIHAKLYNLEDDLNMPNSLNKIQNTKCLNIFISYVIFSWRQHLWRPVKLVSCKLHDSNR